MDDNSELLTQLRNQVSTLGQRVVELTDALSHVNSERTIIFIDNTNLNLTTRKIDPSGNYRLDYNKMVKCLAGGRYLRQVRLYYSDFDHRASLSQEEASKRSEREKFYGFLKWQGYWLKMMPLQERSDGTTKEKGLDAAIIKDMQRLAQQGGIDTFILVAGDLDYKEVVADAQADYGMRVEVAFFKDYSATELKYTATKFIDLTDLKDQIRRDQKESTFARAYTV